MFYTTENGNTLNTHWVVRIITTKTTDGFILEAELINDRWVELYRHMSEEECKHKLKLFISDWNK